MSGDDPSGGPLPVQPYAADIEELHIMRQRKSEEEHMSQRESEEVHRNQRECEEGHMRPSGPRQGAQGKAEEKEEHLRPSGPWQGGEGNAEGKEEKKEDKSQRGPSQGVEGKAEQEEEEHNGQREQPEGVEEPALRGLDDEDETDSDQHLEDIKEDKDKEGKQQHLEKAEGGIPELNRAETFEEIHQATVRQRRNIWQETKQVASEFWQGPEQEWGKENVDAFWAYTFWGVLMLGLLIFGGVCTRHGHDSVKPFPDTSLIQCSHATGVWMLVLGVGLCLVFTCYLCRRADCCDCDWDD